LLKHGIIVVVTFHIHDGVTAVFLGSGSSSPFPHRTGQALPGIQKLISSPTALQFTSV
jgi:hypothetical protein